MRQRERAGVARLPAQGDRLAAAFDRLVRVAEQPEGHRPEGQARHSGVLPVEVGVAAVSLGVVQGNPLLHVFARGGRVAEAEGRDRQRLAGLEELGRILGPLGQREEPLGQLPRFAELARLPRKTSTAPRAPGRAARPPASVRTARERGRRCAPLPGPRNPGRPAAAYPGSFARGVRGVRGRACPAASGAAPAPAAPAPPPRGGRRCGRRSPPPPDNSRRHARDRAPPRKASPVRRPGPRSSPHDDPGGPEPRPRSTPPSASAAARRTGHSDRARGRSRNAPSASRRETSAPGRAGPGRGRAPGPPAAPPRPPPPDPAPRATTAESNSGPCTLAAISKWRSAVLS